MDDEITELLTQAMAFLEEVDGPGLSFYDEQRVMCAHGLIQRAWTLHKGVDAFPLPAMVLKYISAWRARIAIDDAKNAGKKDA